MFHCLYAGTGVELQPVNELVYKQVRKELRGNSHERFFPGALKVYIS